MFCKYCGKEISEHSQFCKYCGGTVTIEKKPNSQELSISKTEKPKSSFIARSKVPFIALTVCLCIAVAGCIALAIQYSTLQAEYSSLETGYYDYQKLYNEYKGYYEAIYDKAEFLDERVSIVVDDGTNLYHKYDCVNWDDDITFWAYNTEYAREVKGYKPCPKCHFIIGN